MLKNIFKPINIGSVALSNRLVVSPMVMNYCTADGMATEKYIAYHEEKAKGGWGLIITEDYAISPSAKGYPYIPGLWKDEQIAGHTELTKRVHAQGAKIFAQIYHAGRQTQQRIIGTQPVSASAIPCPIKKELPRELTVPEIREIIEQYGDCALRAKKAGFDGVQVHGAHGYLISQFMSSYSNKRTDEYGGCFMDRVKFPIEVVKNIREKCGKDFGLDFKMSGEEAVPEGLTIEDMKAVAIQLEEVGVDSINVSIGVYASWYTQVQPAVMGHGWISDFAREIKSVVGIPVSTVGRINDPMIADAIIASGKADLIYMGRASLADPFLPNKAKEGKYEEIIRCTACLQGCTTKIDLDCPGQCVVNPRTGRESEWIIKPAEKKKRVWIAGGGPAGAEAAIVCAQRGHEVTLFEKSDRLGGMFRTASVPPWKGEISTFLAWQEDQMKKLGVDVHLNTELSAEYVKQAAPDCVIVATGSEPAMPPIKGIENSFVRTAVDLLNSCVTMDGNLAVIGGGLIGGETANYLMTHGNTVTIIEMLPEIVRDEPDNMKHFLMKAFKENDVTIYTNTKVIEITTDGCIEIQNGCENAQIIGPFDGILIAAGMTAENALLTELDGCGIETVSVGDAKMAATALEAIEGAYKAALNI